LTVDRIIGQAQVPLPVTAIPYSEPLPPPRKSGRGLFLVAIAAVMLIVCAAGVLIGLSFSGDLFAAVEQPAPPVPPAPVTSAPLDTATSPKAAAERFLAATVAGDQAKADENLCKLLRGNGGLNTDSQNLLPYLVSFKLGDESIKGPAASVGVKLTVPLLGEVPFDLYLIKEDNAWRVCGLGPS
jgi:hypothetical protein